ncbi:MULTISPECIES: SAM-dependent methyltransferase [Amycolatopsis]|uniref:S-adenosyl methyltransferase n=2 Tax=Amycolatopsis TaxID=1813 RepID=A0A1I3Q8S3_9PSEU|nr:SAM-dependent methyltransferase [Amycolatopsis sacchari]SFJ30055.1 S-adenosyl methyltransferase [Amycolatopsis sacchari]
MRKDDSEHAPAAPRDLDLDKPSSARVYDWYLGGSTNYVVDQMFGEKADKQFPLIKPLAMSNRQWLGRVVRAALDEGITQFLDLGSGVPTVGNVHEIVRQHAAPKSDPRVVYVDYEPVAVAHSEIILDKQGATKWAGVVRCDLRDPEEIFAHPVTRKLLDFRKPVCLLMVSVLHFVGGGDNVLDLVARYRRQLAPGSWWAASHITTDDAPEEGAAQIGALAESYRRTQNPAWLRDRAEFESWFAGFELVPPGIVHLTDWRPDPVEAVFPKLEPEQVRPFYWAGVGRVPEG